MLEFIINLKKIGVENNCRQKYLAGNKSDWCRVIGWISNREQVKEALHEMKEGKLKISKKQQKSSQPEAGRYH